MRIKSVVILLLSFFSICFAENTEKPDITIFYAASYAPILNKIKDTAQDKLNLRLKTESSGSQIAIRKITELGRECDVLMLADNTLFKELASSHCSWRIDFINDEVVIGVGIRAQKVDEAEQNWITALLDPNVTIGRIDETTAPIGYRTLLSWKLAEEKGNPGLCRKLLDKSRKPVENVENLAILLKSGEIDYGFVYKSTCISHDIRFIELDKAINLSSPDIDYSGAEITFKKLKSGTEEFFTVKGSPVTCGLSIPNNAPNSDGALKFVRYFLTECRNEFQDYGFVLFKPKFYGSKDEYEHFKDIADYAGAF